MKATNQISFFLLILGLSSFGISVANTYYLSTSLGDDSRTSMEAQKPSTPWKTIGKLNAFLRNVNPGDSILFNRGESYYGSITLQKSGSALLPIVIGAYGSGNKPMITGLSKITTWVNLNNGIFQTSCAIFNRSEFKVVIDNNLFAMGRYPNTGYNSFESHVIGSSIKDNELGSSPDWTNAEIVIKKNRWILDKVKILSHRNNTLTYTDISTEVPIDGFGYFIQNSQKTLDQFGEWFFDSTQKTMNVFFGLVDPNSRNVQISTLNSLVLTNGYNNTIFNDLAFEGASMNTIEVINSQNIQILSCQINLSGKNGISASGSPNLTIDNTTINQTLNVAIAADAGCPFIKITNNIVKNTALFAGMGNSGTGTYEGISTFGDNGVIEYNQIDSTGYNGIYFGGNFSSVKNNLISNFCLIKDDGGGIYIGDWRPWLTKTIVGNIILNGKGNGAGTDAPANHIAEGIYIDDRTANVDISNNVVANCTGAGIKIHNARNVNIRSNTLYNNGIQMLFAHDNIAPEAVIRNIVATKNIFFSRSPLQLNMSLYSKEDDIAEFGSLDSNYFCRPINDSSIIQVISYIWSARSITRNLTLEGWQDTYNQDLKSNKPALRLKDTSKIHFEYNSTKQPKVIHLDGDYIGIDNLLFSDSLTLPPFSSIILLKLSNAPSEDKFVHAGRDTLMFLPVTGEILQGRISEMNRTNLIQQWTNISGPSPIIIENDSSLSTGISNALVGTYEFELKAINFFGLIFRDTIRIEFASGILKDGKITLVGYYDKKYVQLRWEVGADNKIYSFEIERSINGELFNIVGTVDAHDGARTTKMYFYTDKNPDGEKNFYRLKIKSHSTNYTYSNDIRILNKTTSSFSVDRVMISGNKFSLNIKSMTEQKTSIIVVDPLGRIFLSGQIYLQKGDNSFVRSLQDSYAGVFYITISSEGEGYTKTNITYRVQ